MPFRRYSKFRSRPRTSFRRRTGLRTPTQNGSGRWERGEIGAMNGMVVSDDDEIFTLSISVAQIAGRLGPRTDLPANLQSVTLENMARGMELGGISMDLGFRQPVIDPGLDPNFVEDFGAWCMAGAVLYVDRLDTAGVPNALNPPYGRAGTPMVDPSALANPTDNENNDFPQRILWRRSTMLDFCSVVQTPPPWKFQQPVSTTSWHVNRRLRLRLPDDQGLFIAFWTRRANNWPAETSLSLSTFMAGSLYYRVRF